MPMYKTREIAPKEGFHGTEVLKMLSLVDRSDSRLEEYRNPIQKKRDDIKYVKPNELLLGTLDEDFFSPAVLPYNGKSFGMLVVAGKGDGKTQWVKFEVFSQIHERFGYNLLLVDPKNDYSNLHESIKQQELVDRLYRFNLRARGYNAVYYKPAYFNMKERKGQEYIVTLRDFDNLDYGKRSESIKEFLGVDEKTPAGRQLAGVLNKGVPKTIKAFMEKIKNYRKDMVKEKEEAAKASGVKSRGSGIMSFTLDTIISDKVKQGLLGDDGQKIIMEVDDKGKTTASKTVYAAHFPEDLTKFGIVVLQADLTTEKSFTSSCYLKVAVATVWEDRRKFVDTKRREGVMTNPTFLVMDEADTLLPRERTRYSPSREQVNQLLSKGRQYGWGVVAITQQPEMISQEFIKHCDYIVTTRLRSQKLIEILKEKYALEDYEIDELKKLEWDPNKPVKQWCCFTGNPSRKYIPFYPLPPQIAIKQEGF